MNIFINYCGMKMANKPVNSQLYQALFKYYKLGTAKSHALCDIEVPALWNRLKTLRKKYNNVRNKLTRGEVHWMHFG